MTTDGIDWWKRGQRGRTEGRPCRPRAQRRLSGGVSEVAHVAQAGAVVPLMASRGEGERLGGQGVVLLGQGS